MRHRGFVGELVGVRLWQDPITCLQHRDRDERLAGFEEDRARWQALLDEQGEKDVAPPASDDDDDLRRFGDYEAYDDFDDPDYPGYDDPDIPM